MCGSSSYPVAAVRRSFSCSVVAVFVIAVVERNEGWCPPDYQQSCARTSGSLGAWLRCSSVTRRGDAVCVEVQTWHKRKTLCGIKAALKEVVNDILAEHPSLALTWVNIDLNIDYSKLEPDEFVNHFENHKVMTTKAGLTQLLKSLNGAETFFPRCYDMDSKVERERFMLDFQGCAAFYVIQQHLMLGQAQGSKCQARPEILLLAQEALHKWREQLLGAKLQSGEGHREPIDGAAWESFEHYSQLTPEERHASESLSQRCSSPEEQHLQEQLLHDITQANPQAHLDSDRNIWIVKPHNALGGTGLKCMRSLRDILRYHMLRHGLVVQKYIEAPLLLDSRKFDIRQWVLLKSVTPLKAYLFSECYLRRCASVYDITKLDDRQGHFSNWAVNDDGDTDKAADMVMSLPRFKDLLAQERGHADVWEEEIQPQLENIIMTTLKAAQPHMVQRSQCFALYGFDLMLDKHLHLWLMEVNAQPACEARAPFLRHLCKRMTHRLIELACLGKEEPDGIEPDWMPLLDIES